MKKPKIIVVVPVFNEEQHIRQFIAALQSGSRVPDCIIVVDNNSTDKTAAIAQEYTNVTVVSETRQGICYAVAAGYQAAYDLKADIICRSDADARPPVNWLQQIQELFLAETQIVALTGTQTVYDASVLGQYFCLLLDRFIAFSSRLLLRGSIFLRGTNVAFRAQAWPSCKKRLICREDLIHEDMDLSLAMAKTGKVVRIRSLVMPVAKRTFIKRPRKALNYIRRWIRIAAFAWKV